MALTLLFYWRGPLTGRLKEAILAGMVLGGSIEVLQLLVGRAALWHDFIMDLAGIGLATGLVLWKGHQQRAGLALIILMVVALTGQLYFLPGLVLGSYHSQQSFPLISDFEGAHEKWLWKETDGSKIELVRNDDGTFLRLEGGQPSRWPGAQMRYFPHDWTGYSTLKVDVRHVTPGREKVPFTLRLDDYQTRLDQTWVSDWFTATSEWKTYSISCANRQVRHGERVLNLKDLSYILVVLSDKQDSTVIEIDNLRLE